MMKFNFWLKRQSISYEDLIKKNNLKSYQDLLEYSRSLNLTPPEESEVSHYFQEKEKPARRRSNSSASKDISKSDDKDKSHNQRKNSSVRRVSKKKKSSKNLDNKKD